VSVKIMARVWAHSKMKDGKLLVMLALADFANDEGESWPSIPVLAMKARLSDRQVRRVLDELEANGEIRRVRSHGGRNRRNRYFITTPQTPDINTLKEFPGKNNPETHDQKTLVPVSGALNPHRTVNIAKGKPSPPNGTPPHEEKTVSGFREIMALYQDLFVAKVGAKPDIDKVDGKILSDLLKRRETDEVKGLLTFFFKKPPDWVEAKGKFTLMTFKGVYTELLARWKKQETGMRNF